MKSGVTVATVLLMGISTLYAQRQDQNRAHKGPPSFEQLLKDLDSNEDGKLSSNEVKGPLKRDFDKVDLNEDGFITEEEFNKAPKPKRRERNQ